MFSPISPVMGMRVVGAAAMTMVLWASTYVAIRAVGDAFDPGALALLRFAVGSVLLGIMVLLRREPRPARPDVGPVLLSGALWFGAYGIAVNMGERSVDAGTASMIINVAPVLIAVVGGWVLHEGFPAPLIVGLIVAFGGAAVVGLTSSSGSAGSPAGVLWCVAAAVVYAAGVLIQKPVLQRVTPLQVTFLSCAAGTAVCLPWAGSLVHDLASVAAKPLLLGLYIGAVPTAIAYLTWAYVLRQINASRLGVLTYLIPVCTVGLSALFLGEVPTSGTLVGGAICLVGVSLAQYRPRKVPERERARTRHDGSAGAGVSHSGS